MSIKRWLFFILLMFFYSPGAYCQDNFSWEMILPAITNQCRPDNLLFCINQKSCEARGGYWYDQSCHAVPEQLTCDINHLDLCVTEQTCISVGGYWYELSCHLSQSISFINTKKLAGDWYFRMFPAGGSNFIRTYSLDINTIKENPVGSGIFTIEGIDQNGDKVTGTYVSGTNNYTMYVSKTVIDILCEFTFTSQTDVTGCYFEVDKSDETKGPCISMLGTKL